MFASPSDVLYNIRVMNRSLEWTSCFLLRTIDLNLRESHVLLCCSVVLVRQVSVCRQYLRWLCSALAWLVAHNPLYWLLLSDIPRKLCIYRYFEDIKLPAPISSEEAAP